MKLFKILFCNYVYYHRHTRWGDRDLPVFLTFIMLCLGLFFYLFMIVSLLDIFVINIPLSTFKMINYILLPIFVVFLYWRIVGNKRYIGILKNRKYYSKTCKVVSFMFMAVAFVCLFITGYLLWAHSNGLI